ncbi:MAG: imidazolonepropionase [Flavobacteriales bacterium]|nr:imidazolonepropionase [Flavobacteriales bacterium]
MKILIKNIKELFQVREVCITRLSAAEMSNMPSIKNAWLATENGIIVGYGAMGEWTGITDWTDLTVIDAEEKFVFPSFCDSHTHLIYASSRENEFEYRIKGLSYEQIAEKGGGILNSANKLRTSNEDDLFNSAMQRINAIIKTGTGAVEIKSGYGLDVDSELKMLRVIKRIKEQSPITVKTTLLAAHAIPNEYKNNRKAYIKLITDTLIPLVKEECLADFIDVFCERNYFTPEETREIIFSGNEAGLRAKIHVNQFSSNGGIQVAVKENALSVDHLEVMHEKDFSVLKNVNTIPCLLPSCSFFIGIPYAPAQNLLHNNIPFALATDYNPGSSPSGSMPFVISLACIKMKLTPEQAINAATLNGAYAMNTENETGSITIGKKANLFITKPLSSLAYLPYAFTENYIDTIILNGKIVNS